MRHLKSHVAKVPINNECQDTQQKDTSIVPSEINTSAGDLRQELLQYNNIYLEKLERGKSIYDILCEGCVMEDSLPTHHKQALEIYRKSRRHMEVNNIELRPWQHELLEKIQTPTEREVIWVKGMKGNEGKTWFQKYVCLLYGCTRVVMLDLKSKTSNILHALRKFPLSTVDNFSSMMLAQLIMKAVATRF